MCKLFILSNTSKLTHAKLERLIQASANTMGVTDDQGFGWSILNGSNFTGERLLEPKGFESKHFNTTNVPKSLESIFEEIIEHEAFGSLPRKLSGGLLVHARISTNQVNLENTHPLLNDSWSLIHNGVVTNEGQDFIRKTTNDTEFLLQHLTTGGLTSMVSGVAGYYAVGALNKVSGELLVVKDNIANLFACYIPFLESMAFGTSKEQLASILKFGGFKFSKIKRVKDNTAFLFDRNGKLLKTEAITPVARKTYSQADYAKSMGYEIDDYRNNNYSNQYDTSGDYNRKTTYYDTWLKKRDQDLEDDKRYEQWLDRQKKEVDAMTEVAEVEETSSPIVDGEGNEIPIHKLDEQFDFVSWDGNMMTAKEYAALSEDDKAFVEVYDKISGEPLGQMAS